MYVYIYVPNNFYFNTYDLNSQVGNISLPIRGDENHLYSFTIIKLLGAFLLNVKSEVNNM